MKVMLTIFFDYQSLVDHKYALKGQTVNREYQITVLHGLSEAVQYKDHSFGKIISWKFHHDNTLPNASQLIQILGKTQLSGTLVM